MNDITFLYQECSGEISHFGISASIDQQTTLVKRVKFRVESFHGEAGGLQYLAFHGVVRKSSIKISIDTFC